MWVAHLENGIDEYFIGIGEADERGRRVFTRF